MTPDELQEIITRLKSAGLELTREEYFEKLDSGELIPIPISPQEYLEVAEPVIEAMGIDWGNTTEKLDVYMLTKSQFDSCGKSEFSGLSYKAENGTESNRDEMYIDISCRPQQVITTIGHEIGHVCKENAFSEDSSGEIAEAIAIRTEREFVKKFNEMYGVDVKIEEHFVGHQDKYEEGERLAETEIAISPIRTEYMFAECAT